MCTGAQPGDAGVRAGTQSADDSADVGNTFKARRKGACSYGQGCEPPGFRRVRNVPGAAVTSHVVVGVELRVLGEATPAEADSWRACGRLAGL